MLGDFCAIWHYCCKGKRCREAAVRTDAPVVPRARVVFRYATHKPSFVTLHGALPVTAALTMLCALGYRLVNGATCEVVTYWQQFLHVDIMIFIGFGYLMVFLRQYGYSAVGLNFLLSCICCLWNILVSPRFRCPGLPV